MPCFAVSSAGLHVSNSGWSPVLRPALPFSSGLRVPTPAWVLSAWTMSAEGSLLCVQQTGFSGVAVCRHMTGSQPHASWPCGLCLHACGSVCLAVCLLWSCPPSARWGCPQQHHLWPGALNGRARSLACYCRAALSTMCTPSTCTCQSIWWIHLPVGVVL